MTTSAGSRLSHYRLQALLGTGGMGVVWKAFDERLQRFVAVKILPASVRDDLEWLARLEAEARAVAAINHPNIVTLHSVEEADGVRFLTMELVEGRVLTELIPPGGMPLRDWLDVAVPLLDAVASAHERGLVHRDLKPANIMVSDEGRLKVLDFGLARFLAAPVVPGGDAAAILSGTLAYMAPEQFTGAPSDPRTDLFAVGVVLYEAAVGRLPFGGGQPEEIANAVLNGTPDALADRRPELPAPIGRLVHQCLAKSPADRPASAREVVRELDALRLEWLTANRARGPSVAVLPLRDLSAAKDQGYLCDGFAEAILAALAQLDGVRVASRTSAFRWRGSTRDVRAIAAQLGVAHVLEGALQREGDRLRISVGLADGREGSVHWSAVYERELRDVFALEREIATSVASALEVALRPDQRRVLERRPTAAPEAYEFWLRGRHFLEYFSRRGIDLALQMFQRAIEIDPGFALAHAGIADANAYLWLYVNRDTERRALAEASSRRALELDPALPQAHVSRGVALSLRGLHDEATAEFETAARLDPQLFEAAYFHARDCFARGQHARAIELYERASALRPEDYCAPLLVAQSYDELGRHEEAQSARRRGVRAAELHLDSHPDDVRALYMAANGLVALGERERGLEWTARALEHDPDDSMLLYNVACIRSLAGETGTALDALEAAVEAGLVQREWIEHDGDLAPLRTDARFRALLDRLASVN